MGPDLGVSISQSSAVSKIGQPVTFTASIVNLANASSAMAAPTALITLPAGFVNASAASAGGWSFVSSGPVISATYTGALPILPGHVLPSISVTATPGAIHTGNLVRAQAASIVVSEFGDTNLTNNAASVQTTVANMRDDTPTAVSTPGAAPTSAAAAGSPVTGGTPVQVAQTSSTPTVAPAATGIDFAISKVASGSSFSVGDTITYTLAVSSIGTSDVATGTPIEVDDTVPLGLTGVTASGGSDWTVSSSSTMCPCSITAMYSGTYPVVAGTVLPPITITGTVAATAASPYANTASLIVPGDTDTSNNTATSSVTIAPAVGSPTPTSTETPVAGSPTVTSTETPVAGSPTVTSTETPVAGSPTVTSTETPVAGSPTAITGTVTASPTPVPPALDITQSHLGTSDTFSVGDPLSFVINVSNNAAAGPETQPITLFDLIPVGFDHITANGGPQWQVSVSNATSPTAILATYVGTYPVAPGTVLPPLTISGNLTGAVGPTFTNTVVASSSDYQNPAHSASYVTVNVTPVASGPGGPSYPGGPGGPGGPGVSCGPTEQKCPDLQIVKSSLGGDHFRVGDDVTFFIAVSNVSDSASVDDPSIIMVNDVIPIGLNNIHVEGKNWHFNVSDHNSPSVIDASFTGSAPLMPGQTLPVITITGRLTNDAVPTLTDTATVDLDGDSDVNTDNNTVMYTICVKKQHHHHQQENHHFVHQAAFGAAGAAGYPRLPLTGSDPDPRLRR
ncbi:DUF11 domain-containing protein [Dictyobacter aurantiacus]|uniref:DUF11 domain-containing protein n=1 Tax=Dictyobacter aurantiacus TaxID=1936993 RepID=A0A401ZCY1_9CHLR|nr:DUF11 domain-containing protein [Dictyobacter aurantiacus]GCE04751.1 hypothetical protein KDAU_20800 [Dictyobacter aurantiacus]